MPDLLLPNKLVLPVEVMTSNRKDSEKDPDPGKQTHLLLCVCSVGSILSDTKLLNRIIS